jgi:peptidoglycan/LPS O-acetylase OafA/YrhL
MSIVEKFNVRRSAPLTILSSRYSVPAPAASKLLGLELLRFASALAVLFYHYKHFTKIPGTAAIPRADIPFNNWLWPLYDYGQFGVQLFWGISGYIFFLKYAQAIHARAVSASQFFWLRFSRLYPLHFTTLILVAGFQLAHWQLTGENYVFPADEFAEFVRHIFLATDWGARPSQTFNAPIWSVSAEVAVYAAFFLLLRRFAPSVRLCLSIVLIGFALQLYGFKSIPVICAMFFFAGGMAAMLPPMLARQRLLAASIAALIVGAAAVKGILHDPYLVPWVILACLPFLLTGLTGDFPGLDRWQRRIEAAGNLTHSTYLLHFPMQLMFAVAVAWTGVMPDFTQPAFLLSYLASVIVAGAFCYRAFELPAQDWVRRRVLKARAAV